MKPAIRWMIRKDMPAVLQIENESFDDPWPEKEFIEQLQQRNCIAMVAEHDDEIVGFVVYEIHKTRMRFLNFAVAKQWRRMGVGREIASHQIRKLCRQRRSRITLEVRDSNLAAQLFWRSMGFKAIQVLRDYYESSDDDAYVMEYRVESAVEV